ncbi:Uncharacterised protein [Vibrio cholerae]|nr:Uncharacterised protein [Vibrio cholerae]CSB71359.1 Uncharacterised protein [Vibrio cholerae]
MPTNNCSLRSQKLKPQSMQTQTCPTFQAVQPPMRQIPAWSLA